MAINRRASGSWTGDLKGGAGTVSTQSGAIKDLPFSFGTRFGDVPGTNPEELIAAAHAGCYSMALTAYLASQNIAANRVETKAICTLEQIEGGFKIAKMHLNVTGDVPGIDAGRFTQLATEAERQCPVSNALRGSLQIELEAHLT
ncbi:MAG: OsmC family peroxiredoxin [Candidatus Eremiobacteraeota bacterium]|nr:OsmC family peroxiredoxin [Candidatus Eremiobacteraeota bacterium]